MVFFNRFIKNDNPNTAADKSATSVAREIADMTVGRSPPSTHIKRIFAKNSA